MITALILLTTLLVTLYLYATRHFNYWKNRGIFYLKPIPFIGNLGPIFTLKCSIGEFLGGIYTDYPEQPYVGIFLADKPCLVVRDYNLVQRIFQQDFNYFNNRILTISKKTDPIGSKSLFSIHGKEWKNTRAKLSPIFTAKKQRVVFDTMLGVGRKLEKKLENPTIDVKELSSCFTADTISDAVFRFDGTAIENPDTDQLRKLGTSLFAETIGQGLRLNTVFLAPELMDFFNIAVFPESLYKIMREIVQKSFSKKIDDPTRKGDYIDALLDLQTKGPWEGNDGDMIVPDNENMVAQLFMFFTAGFETAASGITFCMYEMAKDLDIQEKLRDEYKQAMLDNDGVLNYDVLNNMSYLHKFMNECLRKHPPFPFVDRICSADYTIPGTNVVIEKGTKLMIPMLGLHRDERYYENPDSIIPERFDDMDSMKDKPYFPFGSGPRTCLGMRFAIQLLKISIISCLKNHKLTVSPKTPSIIRMSPRRFGNTPICDVILDVQRLN